jgi:hypothetical protein
MSWNWKALKMADNSGFIVEEPDDKMYFVFIA